VIDETLDLRDRSGNIAARIYTPESPSGVFGYYLCIQNSTGVCLGETNNHVKLSGGIYWSRHRGNRS
jgi:hypothetical protein